MTSAIFRAMHHLEVDALEGWQESCSHCLKGAIEHAFLWLHEMMLSRFDKISSDILAW